jgi:hypothetical protein
MRNVTLGHHYWVSLKLGGRSLGDGLIKVGKCTEGSPLCHRVLDSVGKGRSVERGNEVV